MIYTDATKKALLLAFEAHNGQLDKAGLPYICHPLHVAEQMTDEDSAVVALLHDVAEDTDVSLEDIAAAGFKPEVMRALTLLTHDKAVPYLVYVRALAPENEVLAKKSAQRLKELYPQTEILCYEGDPHIFKAVYRPEIWIGDVRRFLCAEP